MEEDLSTKLKEEVIEIANNLKNEIGKIKKKNQKLEEGYIKLNTDLKNLKSDRKNLENFLKIVFNGNENSDSFIISEYGLYDSDELKKMWMVTETTKEGEFQKLLSNSKEEKNELLEEIKNLKSQLNEKSNEISIIKKTLDENQSQLNFYTNNFKTTQKKNQELESEKNYLIKIIDEKTNEIDRLQYIELELAEVKAQQLLMDDNEQEADETQGGNFNLEFGKASSFNEIKEENKKKNIIFSGKEELKIGK